MRGFSLAAAMVATQTPGTAMPGQVRITTVAATMPAALMTHQDRRIAPAIKKNHHLFLSANGFGNGIQRRGRKALLGFLLAQIQHPPVRQRCPVGPFAQAMPGVFSQRGIAQRFKRRCCTSQYHRYIEIRCPLNRHIAGRITKTILLLERAVVFFVENNQSGSRQWREQGRACPHYQRGAPGPGFSPGRQPFALTQTGVNDSGLQAQSLTESSQQLWSQSDFRNQNQCLPPGRQYFFDQAHVDLGLPATRDSVK